MRKGGAAQPLHCSCCWSRRGRRTGEDPRWLRPRARRHRDHRHAAAESLARAIELGVDNSSVHANLGYVLTSLGRLDEAERHLSLARSLDPTSFAAQLNTGLLLARERRFADALPYIETAVKLRPDVAEARNDLGAVLVKLGRVDDAILQLQEAVRVDPTFAPARHNLELLGRPQP